MNMKSEMQKHVVKTLDIAYKYSFTWKGTMQTIRSGEAGSKWLGWSLKKLRPSCRRAMALQ